MNNKSLIIIGQFSLAGGILIFLLSYFSWNNYWVPTFIAGVLLGLAFVLNLVFLMRNSGGKE